jgi:sodium transport system permease protein
MTSIVRTVARKELMDAVRDRRSIGSLLLTSLFGPIMMSLMLRHQAAVIASVDHLVVPVVGAERAPALVSWLRRQPGVTIAPAIADPDSAVQDGRAEAIVVVDDRFGTDFASSEPAIVRVLADSSRATSEAAGVRVTSLLTHFSNAVAASRLIVRGVSPVVAGPLDVVRRDVATSGERGAVLLNVVLVFLSMAVLTAGMQIATDSTAGERERGSLEALLLNPVSRWQLVIGKWLAALAWATVGLALTMVLSGVALSRVPLELLGIRLRLDASTAWLMAAAMWPLAILAPAIQVYLSCFARSFKEAQSYSVFLILPVASLGLLSALAHVTTQRWMSVVPLLAQYTLGSQVLAGRVPSVSALAFAALEAIAIASLVLMLAARLFQGERMLARG